MPLLTVGMSVYNAMPYLPAAIESILRQTYENFHFLIVNDGSTDDSGNYLDSIKDARVQVMHQENQGLGVSLNKIIEKCDTEFLARMDADDISYPERLELQINRLKKFPELIMLGTQVEFICNDRKFSGPRTPKNHDAIYRLLLQGKPAVCHPSCVFQTKALQKVGGYWQNRFGEESDIFLKMCEIGQVANLGEVLQQMRIRRGSMCFESWDEIKRWRAFAIECSKCRSTGKTPPSSFMFFKKWKKRGAFRSAFDYLDGWSAVEYRNAIMDIAESRRIKGIFRMVVAAACRPEAVFRRIVSKFHRGKDR